MAREPRTGSRTYSPPGAGRATGDVRRYGLLFILICLGYFLTVSDTDFGWLSDGQVMLDTAVNLHDFGELKIGYDFDPGGFSPRSERSGRYGLGLSLVEQAPLLIAGRAEKYLGGGGSNILFPLVNLILTALTAAVTALSLREMGGSFRAGAFAATGFAFGTFAWPYVSYDFSEPLQAFCVVCTFWLCLRAMREDSRPRVDAILAGVTLGFAILTKVALLVLAPVFVVYLWVAATSARHRWRSVASFAGSLGLCSFIVMLFNWHRFGSVLELGYGAEGSQFTTPLLTGLYGLLLSPNKGLAFYAPLALLLPWSMWATRRRHYRQIFFILALVSVQTLMIAKWWSWEGGLSWGPRLLLPILPLVILGAALALDSIRWWSKLFAICFAAGLIVNVLGVLLNFTVWVGVAGLSTKRVALNLSGRPAREYAEQGGVKYFKPEVAISYVPALSPILGHAWLLRARYLGDPFSPAMFEERANSRPALVEYPPLKLDLSLMREGFVLSRLRSAHLWLWDRLFQRPRDEIFSSPIYGNALVRLGDAAVAIGNFGKGFACYRRALAVTPDLRLAAYNLAMLQMQTHSFADAASTIGGYLASHQQDAAARLLLAEALDGLGDHVAAAREYRAYLASRPSSEDRIRVQQRLSEISSTPR